MFNPNIVWHSDFLYLCSYFPEKERNAILLILLKYQEIDVQIQTFTDEDSNISHTCSFEK